MPTLPGRSTSLLAASLLWLLACSGSDLSAPPGDSPVTGPAFDGQSADRCENVAWKGVADLGAPVIIPVDPANPIVGGGALPSPVDLGPFQGDLSSVVLSSQGNLTRADHLTLVHYFQEAGTGDAFWTDDRAVCAPAGSALNVCRVNDVLTIVGGTGKFANAHGQLRNKGTITITDPTFSTSPYGSLTVDIRGRVCGDGV